jgi:hypothetical protein
MGSEEREFRAILGPRSTEFAANYPFDISPVSDERPFFFNRVPIVPWLMARLGMSSSPLGRAPLGLGGQTLLISLVGTALVTGGLVFLPWWLARKGAVAVGKAQAARVVRAVKTPTVRSTRNLFWIAYFASLGLGFILVELVLIQRFNLFLGYPAYSLSVVLFTLLSSSALGSLASERFTSRRALPRTLGLLSILLLAYTVILPSLLSASRGLPTAMRIVVAVGVIAPPGLLMGIPFASGIRRAGAESETLTAWAWAVNGGASVFGSTLAVVASMTYGFTSAFAAGSAAYAASFVLIGALSLVPS